VAQKHDRFVNKAGYASKTVCCKVMQHTFTRRKPAVNVEGQNRREAPKKFLVPQKIEFLGDAATKCFVNKLWIFLL